MRIALLHNPRPAEQAVPEDAFEEFDSSETIRAICEALNHDVVPVVADRDLPRKLESGGFDFAFNIAEGWGRRNREAIPAAICELLELPYSGSDPLTLAITLDKWVARRVVSPEIRVAPAVLLDESFDELPYPVVIKPNDEGSSKGIRIDSVAESAGEASAIARRLRQDYKCPVLAETYLPGAEVTAGVIGNGRSARVIASMEIAPVSANGRFLYSLEVKRDFRRQVRYYVPPRLPAGVLCEIERLALTAFRLLGCRDFARMDFRLDAEGRPCFLECNPLPGLNPETSDIVILSRGILSHGELVRQILAEAIARTGVELS
jgi:D-alanine-D-alanine ligase